VPFRDSVAFFLSEEISGGMLFLRRVSGRTILLLSAIALVFAWLAARRVHDTGALVFVHSLVTRARAVRRTSLASPAVDAVKRAFPEWNATPYGQPATQPAPQGVVLGGGASPSGVFFTRKLNPEQFYRLTVQGRAGGVLPSLRLHLDERPLSWHSLANGANMILPKAAELEALVYADVPYTYNLREIRVEPCPACITDEILKAAIIGEAGISPGDAPLILARKLRTWTANAVVLGPEPVNMTATTTAVVVQPAWQTYVEIFKPGLGGVSCAGIAAYYQKILALFGLPSFTIDMGFDNGTGLTHVTTILVLGTPEQRHFFIFDPTFSGSYVKNGKIAEVMESLRAKRVEFRTTPMSRRVLIPHSELRRFLKDNQEARSRAICDRESPIPETTECRDFVDSPAYNRIMMGRAMAQNGFSQEQDFILGLMRHRVIGVLPSGIDPEAHLEFFKQLAQLGIPVPGSAVPAHSVVRGR
jgi:hypothetical protein